MQQKLVFKLLGYDLSIKYKKGTENKVVDALSRRDEGGKEKVEVSISALSAPTTNWWEEVKQGYTQDPYTSKLFTQCEKDQLPQKFTVRDGLIYYKQRLCVADYGDSRQNVLQTLHSGPSGGPFRIWQDPISCKKRILLAWHEV